MTIEELAALPAPPLSDTAAPDWLIGCFRRRSITFYNGQSDSSTEVYWLQTRSLCVDLRVYPSLSPDQWEGGSARTEWDGASMRWSDWTALQLRDKWPEPGLLRRVGDCVIEFAPSGAYVEDWRLQPSRPGPVVGLRLIEERASGQVTHRGGALIVCGGHAALVRGRSEACYALRDPASGEFRVVLSTNPLRVGQILSVQAGFGLVGDRVRQISGETERIFTIDTLERSRDFRLASDVTPAGAAWLAAEAETLLGHEKGGEC